MFLQFEQSFRHLQWTLAIEPEPEAAAALLILPIMGLGPQIYMCALCR